MIFVYKVKQIGETIFPRKWMKKISAKSTLIKTLVSLTHSTHPTHRTFQINVDPLFSNDSYKNMQKNPTVYRCRIGY